MTATTTARHFAPNNPPTIHEQVIVVDDRQQTAVRTITHTTKSGQFKLDGGDQRFKMYMVDFAKPIDSYIRRMLEIHPYSDAKLSEVQQRCDERREAEEAKRRERREAQDRREAERLEQIAALRAGHVQDYRSLLTTMLPDGARVYQHTFNHRIRRCKMKDGTEQSEDAGWCWVVITCRDVEELLKVRKTESALTFQTARSHSFSGCGTERHASDEDAVYEALRYAYHRA